MYVPDGQSSQPSNDVVWSQGSPRFWSSGRGEEGKRTKNEKKRLFFRTFVFSTLRAMPAARRSGGPPPEAEVEDESDTDRSAATDSDDSESDSDESSDDDDDDDDDDEGSASPPSADVNEDEQEDETSENGGSTGGLDATGTAGDTDATGYQASEHAVIAVSTIGESRRGLLPLSLSSFPARKVAWFGVPDTRQPLATMPSPPRTIHGIHPR